MKVYLVSIALFLATISASSQEMLEFSSEVEAREMISLITDVVGLKPNFEIRAGDVSNAAAVIYNGKRFIIYNPVFIQQIKAAVQTDWGGLSILAHEVGHHLNGHTLMGTGSKPSIELEADEFAGFVLRKLGATLEEAQAAIWLISEEQDSRTHPARSKRMASIHAGYYRAEKQIAAEVKPHTRGPVAEPGHRKDDASLTYNFPKQYILRKVHLYHLPEEEFYITTGYNLVRVTDGGYQVIGKVVKSGNALLLQIGDNGYLKLHREGFLVNEENQKIGHLLKA